MIAPIPLIRPTGAASAQRTGKAMDVILHIGAHRCATTTFQNYLRLNARRLFSQKVGFWGPRRTRHGLFRGILPGTVPLTGRDMRRRAIGRVQMHLLRSAERGIGKLLISDENLMGTMRENLRLAELYCGVGERMARYGEAFGGRISNVVLNVRSQDSYWASALGYSLTRGRGVPGTAAIERLVTGTRCWRDVITDVSCALPDARIWVLPFERFAGRPEAQLAAITGIDAPKTHAREWLNATPHLPELRALRDGLAGLPLPEGDGRWQPFSAAQSAALREDYADDMMWLTGGADGLARLIPDRNIPMNERENPPQQNMTRGRRDGDEERRLARAR